MSNLFQKLLSGASNVANRAEDSLMPSPASGLFNPEDIAAARKQGLLHLGLSLLGDTSGMGLGSALKQGAGDAQGSYQESLANSVAQNTAVKQKQLLETRKMIGAKYAPQPGDTAQSVMARYPQMYMDYMRAGDLDAAKNVEGIVSAQMQHQAEDKLQAVQAGDAIYTFDPKTGTYTRGPERHMSADEKADHAANRAEQEMRMNLMRTQQDMALGQRAQSAFANQNKDLRSTEQLYGNWQGAYDSAKSADPSVRQAAYKSAIVNFARIADPGQRSSLGMLKYLEQVNPSLIGRFHVTAEKLQNGDFPPEVLDAMNKHVIELHKNHVQIYDKRREGRVKAMPMLDQYLDKTEDVFPSSKTMDQPSAAGESRVNNFFKGWGK